MSPPAASRSPSDAIPEPVRAERERLVRQALPHLYAGLLNHARVLLNRLCGMTNPAELKEVSGDLVHGTIEQALQEAGDFDPALSPDGSPRAWLRKGLYYKVLSFRRDQRGALRLVRPPNTKDEPDTDYFDRLLAHLHRTEDPAVADEREAQHSAQLAAVEQYATAREWAVLQLHAEGLTGAALADALTQRLGTHVKPGTAHVWHTRAVKRLSALLRDHSDL